jgi:hypothetical protein
MSPSADTSVSPGASISSDAAASQDASSAPGGGAQPLDKFLEAGARGIVEAQQALDERGRRSLLTWETDGLPPTVWTYSNCRLKMPLAFRVRPKTGAAEATLLDIAPPRREAHGGLCISFRYILTPQAEDVEE